MLGANDLYFLKSLLVSNFSRLNFPFKISYAVTYKCNLRCRMCNIWKKAPKQDELAIGEIDNFFKSARRFSWVGITGGEAFLRPDLTEITDIIIKYCDKLSALHFATNGQLTEKIEALVSHIGRRNKRLKTVFTISLDGPPELHNEIRGVQGAWARAVDTFKYLKKAKSVKAQIGFTMSGHNIGRFKDMFISLKEDYPGLKFDDVNVNIFQKSSFYYENQDMQDIDNVKLLDAIKDILKMDKEGLSLNNLLRREYLKLYPKYSETKKCPVKCQALSSTCFLDPYGNLLPCAVYNKRLLNVKEMNGGLTEAWNKDDAKKLSHECANNACPSCWSPCDAYSAIGGSLKNLLPGRKRGE